MFIYETYSLIEQMKEKGQKPRKCKFRQLKSSEDEFVKIKK